MPFFYGLREDLEEFKAYVLGETTVPFIPYQENGNWEPYLPKYESQSTRFETHGCTVWGSQNQIETFINRLYAFEPNFSERFNYLLTPVVPGKGTDPQKAYECIRAHGLIDQAELPMTNTLADFLDTADITPSLRAHGQNWLVKHDFKHEWLWSLGRRPQNWKDVLRKALRTSPIGVSVSAWNEVNGEYVSYGDVNNHWCLLYNIDDEGYMWVFDSYDHSKKKLAKDHNIRRAKRIWINRKVKSSMRRHISLLTRIKNMLMQRQTLLDVVNASLGTDVSPQDLAKDEVGCAESMTNLLKRVYPETPIITGTWSLFDYLARPLSNYARVTEPSPETIIICPTTPGHPFPGHVGIFMDDLTIASNDSATGRFIKNYDYDTWRARWVDKGGYKIYMFKRI